mmetsp:Transcript_29880/g.86667  ORF Transcript_29880/g.86667 Transcript_29880/m.86667 type:complete len:121 (-) Transcript_29880:1764-2126(-)
MPCVAVCVRIYIHTHTHTLMSLFVFPSQYTRDRMLRYTHRSLSRLPTVHSPQHDRQTEQSVPCRSRIDTHIYRCTHNVSNQTKPASPLSPAVLRTHTQRGGSWRRRTDMQTDKIHTSKLR